MNHSKDADYGKSSWSGTNKIAGNKSVLIFSCRVNIEVLYSNENIWLLQKRMADLFDCTPDNISFHLKNIYREQELDEAATAEDFSVVQTEGNRIVTQTIISAGAVKIAVNKSVLICMVKYISRFSFSLPPRETCFCSAARGGQALLNHKASQMTDALKIAP